MRIAIDTTSIRVGDTQAIGACALDLAGGLAAASPRHAYELLTSPHNHEALGSFERAGVTRRPVRDGVPQGLRAAGIDLLFCPLTAPTYAEEGVPTVCTVHELRQLSYPWFFTERERSARAAVLAELAARPHHIVCASEFTRIGLIGHQGVRPERTSVVPMPVRRLPKYQEAEAWKLLGQKLPLCRFGFYPASFEPHKNHRMLLVAFGVFLAEHPESDLHLVLTGQPCTEAGDIASAIAAMGLTARVHLLGFVSDAELAALWTTAAFLVIPSLFEGVGSAVTEAIEFGRPALCSSEGSLTELGGEEALYFDARNPRTLVDALATATHQPDELARRAARAHARRGAYSLEAVVDLYLALFARVVSPSPPVRAAVSIERDDDGRLLTPYQAYARYLEVARGEGSARDRAQHPDVIALRAALEACEADRAARLAVIRRQGDELGQIPTLQADIAFLKDRIQTLETRLLATRSLATRILERVRRRGAHAPARPPTDDGTRAF